MSFLIIDTKTFSEWSQEIDPAEKLSFSKNSNELISILCSLYQLKKRYRSLELVLAWDCRDIIAENIFIKQQFRGRASQILHLAKTMHVFNEQASHRDVILSLAGALHGDAITISGDRKIMEESISLTSSESKRDYAGDLYSLSNSLNLEMHQYSYSTEDLIHWSQLNGCQQYLDLILNLQELR